MKTRIPAAALIALLISGCATHREFKDIDAQTSALADRAQTLHDNSVNRISSPALRISDSTWVNPEPVKVTGADKNIPVCWPQINRSDTLTIDDVATLIADICHISVRVQPDARGGAAISHRQNASAGTQVVQGTLPLPGSDERGRTPLTQEASSRQTPLSVAAGTTLSGLHWDSSLGALLDRVTPLFGISYRWQNQQLQFYRLDTRTFQLAILNADTSMSSKVMGGMTASTGTNGGNSNSLGGEQNTTQQSDVTAASKVYDDIRNTVSDMLSAEGVSYLSPGSATLTVTDTPDVLNKVAAFIDGQNAILDRQVRLKVDIYRITFKKTKQLGIDWTAVYDKAKSLGYTLTSGLSGVSTEAATIGLTSASGPLSGSEVLVRALNEQANISSSTTYTPITTNLVPAPILVAKQTTYVARMGTTNSENFSSTEMEPGQITTGLFMTVLPYIRDNGTVQLQLSFSLSDEPVITSQASPDGSSLIQTPVTDLRSSSQRSNLQPGQTLVMTGYQNLYNDATRQGTTSSSWFGFGGGEKGQQDRSMLLILVTPSLTS